MVMGVVIYGSETWMLKKKDRQTASIWNEVLQDNIKTKMEAKDHESRSVQKGAMQEEYHTTDHGKETKLIWHICKMMDNRLVKEVMFGTMEWESRRGRPSREWLDDIKEWGGEEIHILNRKAQDHGTWRTVVRTALDT